MKRAVGKLRDRALILPVLVLCASACTGRVGGSGGSAAGAAGSGSAGSSTTGMGGTSPTGTTGAAGTTSPTNDGWPGFAPTTSFQLRRLTTEQYTATVQ